LNGPVFVAGNRVVGFLVLVADLNFGACIVPLREKRVIRRILLQDSGLVSITRAAVGSLGANETATSGIVEAVQLCMDGVQHEGGAGSILRRRDR
jgi:hypothetical protein